MKHARIALIALLATACLVGGCQKPGRSADASGRAAAPAHAGDARQRLLIDPVDAHALGYGLHWSSHLGVASGHELTAIEVLDDLLVAVELPSRLVRAVHVDSGNHAWSREVANPGDPLFHPFRRGQHVYLNNETHLFALNAHSGDLESAGPLPYVVESGPVMLEDRVVYGGIDGTAFALNPQTSSVRWRYQMTGRILTPPVQVGEDVFVADGRGVYRLLSGFNGEMIWGGRTFAAVSASPVTDAAAIYVPSEDGSLYALQRANGRDRWVFHAGRPLTRSPRVLQRLVLQPLPGDGLVALEATDGAERWRIDRPLRAVRLDGDRLLCANPRGLSLLDAETGRTIVEAPTKTLAAVLRGPEDSLILVSPDGAMLRLNPLP